MTGKTHLAVGIATALALAAPSGIGTALAAVIGGGLGGLAPDVDARSSQGARETRLAWLALAGITAASLFVDGFTPAPLWRAVADRLGLEALLAMAVFLATCMLGSLTSHRSFMHSILAGGILTACLAVAAPPLAAPFAAGFGSHLAIDLLNHRGERLLWPLSWSPSLGLCHSGGSVDKGLLALGVLASVVFVVRALL